MFVIPHDRLPPGFGARVDEPPADPAAPAPAATAVLLRDGPDGPEALLLKRHRASGFVPGAYVFPGGRVDAADADPRLRERLLAPLPAEPAQGYWIAAVREVFEETGVFLARQAGGNFLADARDPAVAAAREALLTDRMTMLEVLERLDARLDLDGIVFVAHWITPVAEPRRFDTRFFVARLPAERDVLADPREMVDAVWFTPETALQRFHAGALPMVFPTVRTLESLAGYASVDALLDAQRGRRVEPVLPRLVRTAEGVGIVVDGDE